MSNQPSKSAGLRQVGLIASAARIHSRSSAFPARCLLARIGFSVITPSQIAGNCERLSAWVKEGGNDGSWRLADANRRPETPHAASAFWSIASVRDA